jgi:hypothetical protein
MTRIYRDSSSIHPFCIFPLNVRWNEAIVGVIVVIDLMQLLGYSDNILTAIAQGPQGGNYTFGLLASIQNYENGDPFWIVSGNWRTNLLDISNQLQTANQSNMTIERSSPVFNTPVRMITFNGTGEHTHTLTNFALEDIAMPDNLSTVFNGTSTANFIEGPITDIPTTITFTNGKVISIWLDPAKINYHYGDTPVYGIVLEKMRQPSPS